MTTILLVDDDPLQASCMMSLLGRHFGDVRRATDAAEALCLSSSPTLPSKLGLGHLRPAHAGNRRPPSWPNCTRGCRTCLCWCWAMADESPSDYTGEHVAFLPRPSGRATRCCPLLGQMLAERKKHHVA